MMGKHTPGPWKIDTDCFFERAEVRDYDGRRVCVMVADYPMGNRYMNANARLIAAAPEMLEALEMVQMVIDLGNTVGDSVEAFEQWSKAHDVMVQTVSSALKKAWGEE